jgi:hypothetical protein
VLERFNPVLRIVCAALALLVVSQIARLAFRKDPLAELSFVEATFQPVTVEAAPAKKETNSPPRQASGRKVAAELPPAVQARVDRITQSEILGAVVRPLPMALLGIAGRDAFLRAPNGQTGLIKEGEELGGIKLLRIGTNRVLIEHEQQQKELTVFSGFGSETLLPKATGKANPSESTNQSQSEPDSRQTK